MHITKSKYNLKHFSTHQLLPSSVDELMFTHVMRKRCVIGSTEVDRPRRPTGYIRTPANATFALGSDAVRGQLKVLYPATRWSRGQNPIGRNAMKTRETWNTDGSL